jgi:serine/threonine protein kinase
MAPELLTSENKYYDKKVDVWALGCILYELISGTKTFNGKNVNDIR